MFYNPLAEPIVRHIRVPLHYTGLTKQAVLRWEDGLPEKITIDGTEIVELTVKIPARGRTWLILTAPEGGTESNPQKP